MRRRLPSTVKCSSLSSATSTVENWTRALVVGHTTLNNPLIGLIIITAAPVRGRFYFIFGGPRFDSLTTSPPSRPVCCLGFLCSNLLIGKCEQTKCYRYPGVVYHFHRSIPMYTQRPALLGGLHLLPGCSTVCDVTDNRYRSHYSRNIHGNTQIMYAR